MSAPSSRPSNLRAPSKLLKPSVVPPKSNDAAASPTASGILTENTDDFIVGNRVWVGGTKPGYIQYIGETQFAPGEWAGVVLDEPVGKNDGSVAGVKYFQCEPKRGVFSRLTKLTREPIPGLMAADGQDGSTDDVSTIKANGSVRSASPRPSTPLRLPRSSTPSSLTGSDSKVKLGDRVQVSSTNGTKVGTLRYLGTTEFAVGDWAGVELDEATGKNDGSVAGKRYFECPMKYGLFAPVARVAKLGATSARRVVSSTMTSSPVPSARRTGATPKRTGSHESISTVGSTSSATRSIKPRLGITSLTTGTKPSRSSTTSVTATHTAMQDALKEKEQHIEQLLRERDSVMSEIARATSQRDDVERELANLKTEHGRHKVENEQAATKLREIAEFAEKQRRELEFQLEEERKKVEDLQFRVEEESILKSDLETMKEADTERIKQLEQLYSSEKARADLLEQESNVNFQNEEKIAKYLDDNEVLQNKVQECEKIIAALKSEKSQESSRAGQVTDELIAKDAQIADLQHVIRGKEKVEAEMRELRNRAEQTLAEHQKNLQNQEAIICDLRSKLQLSDNSLGEITQQVSVLEVSSSDLKRKLQAYEERCEVLCEEKSKLENDISELMKSTGDSSTHLTKMIEQLREKEKLAEQLQLELQNAHQDVQRLQDVHEQMKQMHQKELETLAFKNEQMCQEWERKLCKEREEMQNCQVMLVREMNEKTSSLELAASTKDTEINKLKALLDTSNCRVESLTAQLATAEVQIGSSVRETEELRTAVEQKLTEAKNEINSLQKERNELLARRNSMEFAKVDLEKQVEYLNQEKHEQLSAVSQRDKKLALLNSEVDRLKAEFNNYKAELQRKLAENELDKDTLDNMRNVTEMQQRNIEELQQCMMKSEEENERLRKEVEQMQKFEAEKQELEVKVKSFEKLCEEASQRESDLLNKFAFEKEAVCNELESIQTLLVQRTKDLEIQQEKMSLIKIELNATLDLKNQCAFYQQENQKLRTEKEALGSQVQRLEETLAQRPNGIVPEPDSTVQQLLKEKESADDQVNFLNSVIVDMQKKNDELHCRIQVLEVGHLLNDTSDVNLNAVKTPKVAPRLFCDICDRFDIHDTEDCPLQATSDSPPPTQYHGSRNQVRPYCDTCEIFGHWTNECDDNETF